MLLILGATGQVGAQILQSLSLEVADAPRVRVLVRRPEALVVPVGLEVDVHIGSYDDGEAVLRALDGVTDIIISTGDNPGQIEREKRLIDWARSAGSPRIIKISAITAGLTPRVSVGIAHGEIEDYLKQSGLDWVILRPTFFYQSLALFNDPIRKFRVMPLPTRRGAVAFVSVKDVAAVAVRVAKDRTIVSKTLSLTGPEAWRLDEVCAFLGDRLGRKIRHVNPPHLLFIAMLRFVGGVSWRYAELTADIMKACAKGGEGNISPDVEMIIGRRPLGLHDYLEESSGLFS